jgi:DNA-binding transcriptional regulator YhcF (GntR family)
MNDIEVMKELLKEMEGEKIPGRRANLMRRTLELTVLAYDHDQDGLLPSVEACARHLKINRKMMGKTLHKFNKYGIVHETPQGWVVDSLQAEPDSSENETPIRFARKRHRSAAQRARTGESSGKRAVPYYD